MDGGLLALIIIGSILAFSTVVGLIIYFAVKSHKNAIYLSQRNLSDRDLLLLIDEEPDGMMTSKRLAEKTSLSANQSKMRLSYLLRHGVIGSAHDSRLRNHYSLKEPIDDRPEPEISHEPFLTVEDILILFKYHDFKLSYQKICISTGLPISVIKEEIKYFIKLGVLTKVYSGSYGQHATQTFLLQEPYRSNPDEFLRQEQAMNLELEKIYVKEMRE